VLAGAVLLVVCAAGGVDHLEFVGLVETHAGAPEGVPGSPHRVVFLVLAFLRHLRDEHCADHILVPELVPGGPVFLGQFNLKCYQLLGAELFEEHVVLDARRQSLDGFGYFVVVHIPAGFVLGQAHSAGRESVLEGLVGTLKHFLLKQFVVEVCASDRSYE